jgi:hypothetical protein
MKTRIAALVLAVVFAAAPTLGGLAEAGCPPCGETTQNGAPCALTAASCCGDVAPAVPVKTAPELPILHAIAGATPGALVSAPVCALPTASELAFSSSRLRLSVVRRL